VKFLINAFKNSLIFYKTELNEIKEDLQNSSSIKAYEKSLEAKCRAQLKTEETIAELKTLHGFDINDDENVLPTELKLEIESIQNTNDVLIKTIESYEQNLISESESNETKKRIKEIYKNKNS
jgi:hemerythrin superfamily protein